MPQKKRYNQMESAGHYFVHTSLQILVIFFEFHNAQYNMLTVIFGLL
jgi:hypothetical protein